MLSGGLRVEGADGNPNIGFWNGIQDFALWQLQVDGPGVHRVAMEIAAIESTDFALEAAGSDLLGKSPATGGWGVYQTIGVGEVEISSAGTATLKIKPASPATWRVFNLRGVRLSKVKRLST